MPPHAACCMPHVQFPLQHMPTTPSAISVRASLPVSLSLSRSLFRTRCASKKQNFRKFAIEWLPQRRRRRRRRLRRLPASARAATTKMFMHFLWSLTVLKVFRILPLRRRRLLRQRRCVNCMRTKIDEYARRRRTVWQQQWGKPSAICAPQKQHTVQKKKKECCQSDGRDAGRECCHSAARDAAGCKLVARRQPLPLCLLGLPAIWMTMCMGMQLCVCVCAVGNEDDII